MPLGESWAAFDASAVRHDYGRLARDDRAHLAGEVEAATCETLEEFVDAEDRCPLRLHQRAHVGRPAGGDQPGDVGVAVAPRDVHASALRPYDERVARLSGQVNARRPAQLAVAEDDLTLAVRGRINDLYVRPERLVEKDLQFLRRKTRRGASLPADYDLRIASRELYRDRKDNTEGMHFASYL